MTTKSNGYLPSKNPVVRSFEDRGVTYELRLVNCGKAACTKCNTAEGPRCSHGPYWYLCVTTHRGWSRIYLGKILDTSRYRLPCGSVDWAQLITKRHQAPGTPPRKGIPLDPCHLRPELVSPIGADPCADETAPTLDLFDSMRPGGNIPADCSPGCALEMEPIQ